MDEIKTEEKKPRISPESAEKSVQDLLDFYEIEFEDIVNDQGKEGAKTWKNKITRAFQKERLETRKDDDPEKGFCIIQHTSTGKHFTYKEYNHKAAIAYAGQKDNASASFSLLGSLSGQSSEIFKSRKNFSGPDLRLAEAVVMIFFF